MDEYMKESELIEAIDEYSNDMGITYGALWVGLQTAKEIIRACPSSDVVEVVRCKDCKHYCPSAFGGFTCFGRRIPSVSEDDYCNYGERREEDTDNDK